MSGATHEALSRDEFDALREIVRLRKGVKPSACVMRNAKRLSGLKFIQYERDGRLVLTEKGEQTLFLQRSVEALRAVADGQPADADCLQFLLRKGHVEQADGVYRVTVRGRETLDDIAARGGA
jgi:hypothetical protein